MKPLLVCIAAFAANLANVPALPAAAVRRGQGDSTVGRVRRPSSLMREGDIIFIRIPVFLDLRNAQTAQSWESHVGILFRDRTGAWTVPIARFRL